MKIPPYLPCGQELRFNDPRLMRQRNTCSVGLTAQRGSSSGSISSFVPCFFSSLLHASFTAAQSTTLHLPPELRRPSSMPDRKKLGRVRAFNYSLQMDRRHSPQSLGTETYTLSEGLLDLRKTLRYRRSKSSSPRIRIANNELIFATFTELSGTLPEAQREKYIAIFMPIL